MSKVEKKQKVEKSICPVWVFLCGGMKFLQCHHSQFRRSLSFAEGEDWFFLIFSIIVNVLESQATNCETQILFNMHLKSSEGIQTS